MYIIPDKRIKKFTNAAMNVCRNTEQLQVSFRIELNQRKCVPMVMYGSSADLFVINKKID